MDYLKKYQTETKRNPYCWNAKGEYIRSGSYSDDYVKWLEKQLLQTDVSSSNYIDESPEPRINIHRFNDNEYDKDGRFLR